MTETPNNRQYIHFDPQEGWFSGKGLFYECLLCGKAISSTEDSDCTCHNLYVDASAGRIGAKQEDKVRLFRFIDGAGNNQ